MKYKVIFIILIGFAFLMIGMSLQSIISHAISINFNLFSIKSLYSIYLFMTFFPLPMLLTGISIIAFAVNYSIENYYSKVKGKTIKAVGYIIETIITLGMIISLIYSMIELNIVLCSVSMVTNILRVWPFILAGVFFILLGNTISKIENYSVEEIIKNFNFFGIISITLGIINIDTFMIAVRIYTKAYILDVTTYLGFLLIILGIYLIIKRNHYI